MYILACMRVYIPICQGAYTTMHTCIVLTGVAVATAFCPIESAAVTLPSEWLLGVTDIHTYVFCYYEGRGVTDTGSYFVLHLYALLDDAWLIVWLISLSAKKLLS